VLVGKACSLLRPLHAAVLQPRNFAQTTASQSQSESRTAEMSSTLINYALAMH